MRDPWTRDYRGGPSFWGDRGRLPMVQTCWQEAGRSARGDIEEVLKEDRQFLQLLVSQSFDLRGFTTFTDLGSFKLNNSPCRKT